jgi:hypothetical protein
MYPALVLNTVANEYSAGRWRRSRRRYATRLQRDWGRGRRGGTVAAAMISQLGNHPQYALLAGVLWILIYVVYKIGWRRDYGLPVRRRILAHKLVVDRNQVAYVPFWWSDLQVQRALNSYWKRTLRRGFEPSGRG